MNYEKPIYYITIIIVLISIATSPVLAESFKIEDKVGSEKLNNQNNTVVAKAATSTGSVSTNCSNNSNSTTQTSTSSLSGNEAPKKLKQTEILKASVYVNKYVTKYKKLPNKVTIRGYDFSIPEYTYLLSSTIYYKYNKKNTEITVKYDVKSPTKPTGTKIKGKLNSKQYYQYSKNLMNYIKKYNKAPNYVTTKLGKMQYQTSVYAFNRILYWSYNNKNKMPNTLTLNIAKTHKMNKVIPEYKRPKVSSSQPVQNTSTGNWTTVETKYSCGPTQVMYNGEYLVSTGKCSCGKSGDYCYHESSFKNYCPYCKIDGLIIYEEGSTCPEGMWVCTKCDADFCLVTGKEHVIKSPKYLTAS